MNTKKMRSTQQAQATEATSNTTQKEQKQVPPVVQQRTKTPIKSKPPTFKETPRKVNMKYKGPAIAKVQSPPPKTPKVSKPLRTTVHQKNETKPVFPNAQNVIKEKDVSSLIQNRLKGKSIWYKAIMDPVHNAGCKIPDANGTATATLQCNIPVTQAVNAAGMTGCRILLPYPNTTEGATPAYNYQLLDPTSTPTSLIWSNGVAPANLGIEFPAMASLKANAQGVRIVSSQISCMPEISSLSDSGEILNLTYPFGWPEQTYASPMSYSSYATIYDTTTTPIRVNKPTVSRWYPTEMEVTYSNDETVSYSYRDFISPKTPVSVTPGWCMAAVTTGSTASTGSVRFIITVNYEYIPTLNTFDLLSPAVSPMDEMEETFVLNQIQQGSLNGTTNWKKTTTAPTPCDEQNDSGFGFLLDIIQTAGPLVLEGVKALV